MALCTFLQLKIQKGINSQVWHQPVSFQNTSAPSGVFPSFRFPRALRASVPLEQSPMQSLVSGLSCGDLGVWSSLHTLHDPSLPPWLGWVLLRAAKRSGCCQYLPSRLPIAVRADLGTMRMKMAVFWSQPSLDEHAPGRDLLASCDQFLRLVWFCCAR